jgi:hypothetical protein
MPGNIDLQMVFPPSWSTRHAFGKITTGAGGIQPGYSLELYFDSASALGNVVQYQFLLAQGIYTFYVTGVKRGDCGIIKWTLDGVDIITGQDWYAASETHDVYFKVSNINVTYSGQHTLSYTVMGKNASSSGYFIGLGELGFYK